MQAAVANQQDDWIRHEHKWGGTDPLHPGEIEGITAVIIRNEHYASKDDKTGYGLCFAAYTVDEGKNQYYQ